MTRITVLLFHGVLLTFVSELVLAIASQQVLEGNYIVPRTTLELSRSSNKSADGHKMICTSNLDCEMYTNDKCCLTISGYSKCRRKCRSRKKLRKYRPGKKRRKNNYKHKKKEEFSVARNKIIGCAVIGHDKIYKEGELVEVKDGCDECTCLNGKVICKKRQCPPRKCTYNNKLYDDGYRLVLHNGCKRCICQYRVWNCTVHPCVKVIIQEPNSAVSILPSIILAFMCLVMLLLLLTR